MSATPLSQEQNKELYDHLEVVLTKTGCDHSLRHTRQWLLEHD